MSSRQAVNRRDRSGGRSAVLRGSVFLWMSRTPTGRPGRREVIVPDRRTEPDDIDPSDINTAQELILALRQIKARAGSPTLGELQRRARAEFPPLPLSTSTTSEVLRGKREPTEVFLRAYLQVCGLDSDRLEAWEAARRRTSEQKSLEETPNLIEAHTGIWYFPDQRPVTIVCARLPKRLRDQMPYADPRDPDYVRSYTYADLDSLIELYGHVRAVNPDSQVGIRTADALESDDHTSHLVLLGG